MGNFALVTNYRYACSLIFFVATKLDCEQKYYELLHAPWAPYVGLERINEECFRKDLNRI